MKRFEYSTLYNIIMSVFAVVGLFLLIAGFYVPPLGIIDNSVLIAFGECGIFISVMMYLRTKDNAHKR
jgi:uncharacterized membrane protein YiaA